MADRFDTTTESQSAVSFSEQDRVAPANAAKTAIEDTWVEADKSRVEAQSSANRLWRQLALGGVMLLSLSMNFYQLGQNGFGNLYYAAGVRSMLDSWHTFFFVSYDPGGFVALDKPPLGFWLQVLSAKVFGFSPFSVYLPQALAGVLSVALLYYLVRRHFGIIAGLLASLALALSPISVVTNRNNTIDSTLALVLLLGAWAVLKAAETGRLRWLWLCAAIVGIGFNIKMLEAYLVVPTFGLLYVLAAPQSIWKRLGSLALAVLLLLAVSLSWALAVDLTPASLRPYVGSSQNNSEISLALGYNGISRLLGQFGIGGAANSNAGATPTNPFPAGLEGLSGQQGQPPQANDVPNGFFDIGTPGILRLFNEPLGGQSAWLLPLALLGMLALAWQRRPRLQRDRQQQSLVLWGMWLLTMGIFFSVANFFHQYYLTEMAPALAALFGIGIVTMWRDYLRPGWRGWLLPLALTATALEQMHILTSHPAWGQWLIPVIALLSILGASTLTILRPGWLYGGKPGQMRFMMVAISITVVSLMIAPTVWAGIPVLQNAQSPLPVAGPNQQGGFGGISANSGASADMTLLRYLAANRGKVTFLVATDSSMPANAIILATNQPVMALGGFGGSDPILTTSQLAALVNDGAVRFFLLNAFSRPGLQGHPPFPGGNLEPPVVKLGPEPGLAGMQRALTLWVTQHCAAVQANKWQSSPNDSGANFGPFGQLGANQLYDCATIH